MKRRLFLVTLLMCGAAAGAAARQQQVPPGRITVEEFKTLHAEGKVLTLDVRHGPDQKIKGAVVVPLDHLESRLAELPRGREVVTYCS
jgi:rhodanese-related sulfurtransferase